MLGLMRELNEDGHTEHTWDSENPDEVATAREVFNKLKAKHFAFVTDDGDRMDTFDPEAGNFTATPRMAGG